jgi:L-lactate utilization protein LutB
MEADLRRAGLYEEYEKNMMQGNMQAWAAGLEQWVADKITESMTYVTEAGDVEDWKGNSQKQSEKLLENMNNYLSQLREHMK